MVFERTALSVASPLVGVVGHLSHTRRLAEYGGIWKQMPVFAGLFLIIVMGSAGLPALSGFVGEFLTIFGTFNAADTLPHAHFIPSPRVLGALAATGVILGAVYLLWMFQKVFFGKLDKARNGKLPDLRGHELLTFAILAISIFALGLFPRPLLNVMEPSVEKFIKDFDKRVTDCDMPDAVQAEACKTQVHVFGLPPPAISAQIEKQLDAVAAGAQGVADGMKR